MAGWNNYGYRNMIPSGVDEDFREEDVWSYGYEREDSSFKERKSKDHSSSTCSSGRKHSSAPRSIHKASNPVRSHEHEVNMAGGQQSSAPVKIPDWSKIYGKSSTVASRNGSWVDDGGCGMGYGDGDPYVDDDDDGHHGMVPPHEWLSRKHARSQASSFSMCEGVGRTLKGRDLSKLRNAILTKTGFLE